jgi:hypothetical protein
MTSQGLSKASENWMKDTSNNCMIVTTLIATIVFVVAFTIPSDNNQETGAPIFFESNRLMLFFISSYDHI